MPGVQPAPASIAESIDRILARFPDLDLFVDAGDATHSNLPDEARGLWTEHLQGRCGGVSLFYTTGNHEMTVWGKEYDTEHHMDRMGNCPCRPYYSYDIKGVHFVSLPPLYEPESAELRGTACGDGPSLARMKAAEIIRPPGEAPGHARGRARTRGPYHRHGLCPRPRRAMARSARVATAPRGQASSSATQAACHHRSRRPESGRSNSIC